MKSRRPTKKDQYPSHFSVCKLVLSCSGGCGETIPVELPITTEGLANFLLKHKWYSVVLTPMELAKQGVLHFGSTCRTCALAMMPEIVKMVDEGKFPKRDKVGSEKDLLS